MRSRVGRGSGAISAAPATRESAPTLLCKNATEETHTTARLECVVVVGKIADFADADDIFFFFFAFYERVSKGATSSVDRDGSRGEEVFFAAKNHKEWWCPSFLKSRRRLLPPPRFKSEEGMRSGKDFGPGGVHRTHLLHCFLHERRVLFLLRFEKSMQ